MTDEELVNEVLNRNLSQWDMTRIIHNFEAKGSAAVRVRYLDAFDDGVRSIIDSGVDEETVDKVTEDLLLLDVPG